MTKPTEGRRQLFKRVAERLQQHEFKGWFYGDSIGFEGLIAAGDLLGVRNWQDFSHGFFRAWATRMEPFQPDDNTAPGHVMCEIVRRTGDTVLRQAVVKLAEHLGSRRRINNVSITFRDTRRALREPYGGVKMTAEETELLKDPGEGIYLDCMHFDPPFFAHLHHIGQGEHWSQRAVDEILGYSDLLRDPELQLYRHFWLEKTGRGYTRGWGRGQGWALLGLLDVIKYASPQSKGYDAVVARARELSESMVRHQLADGNWHALVHEPKSGAESSTAAFMATAFYRGIKLGILPEATFRPAADRAYDAMLANLDGNGDLRGVSAAVYSALAEEHYWYVPVNFIVPWGQGPVLTAALARQQVDL